MAAKRFHISTKTNKVGPCYAGALNRDHGGKGCPFGGDEIHFPTKEEAQAALESRLADTFGTFSTVKRIPPVVGRDHPDFGKIDSQVEMDSAFGIDRDGNVVQVDTWAPEVYFSQDGLETPGDWEAVNGYSGQYGYSGPVMHPSEVMDGSKMEEYVRENPGTYALVVPTNVDAYDSDDPDAEIDVDGWVLLKLNDGKEPVAPKPPIKADMADMYVAGYRPSGLENTGDETIGFLARDGEVVGSFRTDNRTNETTFAFDSKEEEALAEKTISIFQQEDDAK